MFFVLVRDPSRNAGRSLAIS